MVGSRVLRLSSSPNIGPLPLSGPASNRRAAWLDSNLSFNIHLLDPAVSCDNYDWRQIYPLKACSGNGFQDGAMDRMPE